MIDENGKTVELSSISTDTNMGASGMIYGNALRGFDTTGADFRESVVDHVGYSFFTRPMLNLTKDNIRNDRKLYAYLSTDHSDVSSYVRVMLDRLLAVANDDPVTCPLADNLQAFIPILSRNLLSATGHPDVAVDSYTSPLGSRNQQYNILDGTDDIYRSVDLTLVFKNTVEDAVYRIWTVWIRYMVMVKQGIMSPYTGFIARRLVDSHSRLWRIILTPDKKRVKRIGATGPLYPDVNAVGKYYDITDDGAYNKAASTHSVKVKCMVMTYDDPILIHEFNRTVGFFNPSMRRINEGLSPESVGMMLIPPGMEGSVKSGAYPRINDTAGNAFEWYAFI